MFSNSPFSAAPFSSLEENLVEAGASLDAFCFLNLDPVLKIIPFSPTYLNAQGSLIPVGSSRFLTNISLNAEGVLNSTAIIKSYITSNLNADTKLYSNGVIQLGNSIIFNAENRIYTSTLIKTLGDARLSAEANFLTNYFTKVYGTQYLNANGGLNADSILKNFNSTRLLAEGNLVPVGTIKLYPTLNLLNARADLYLSPSIHIDGQTTLPAEARLISNYLSRVIGDIHFDARSDLYTNGFIKFFNTAQLNAESNINATLGGIFSNSANFDVVATFTCNLSQRNQDIVYYILSDRTTKSFTLNIMRVKK
jgi:hypothetical protein